MVGIGRIERCSRLANVGIGAGIGTGMASVAIRTGTGAE